MTNKITKRFFKEPRVEILKILIEELEVWKDATTPTLKEFLRLADRLGKLIK